MELVVGTLEVSLLLQLFVSFSVMPTHTLLRTNNVYLSSHVDC